MALKMEIVLGTNAMEITPLPTALNSTELLVKAHIAEVLPVKRQVKPVNGNAFISTVSGPFELGETITGGTSSATATLFRFDGTTRFYLMDIVGDFVVGETLTGNNSAETAVLDKFEPTSFDEEWTYRYPTITVVCVRLADGSEVQIELQDVTNQPTWNDGSLAAQNAAVTDINAWL